MDFNEFFDQFFKDPAAPKLEISDLPCNCPWMECAAHPNGLCSGRAAVAPCRDSSHAPHYLGDGSLGADIHICKECGTVLLNVFKEEILILMQDFTEHIPVWLKPLENMCRESYQANGQAGWIFPQVDALAVLSLAFIVVALDTKNSIPVELLERLAVTKAKTQGIARAFDMSDSDVKVSHD